MVLEQDCPLDRRPCSSTERRSVGPLRATCIAARRMRIGGIESGGGGRRFSGESRSQGNPKARKAPGGPTPGTSRCGGLSVRVAEVPQKLVDLVMDEEFGSRARLLNAPSGDTHRCLNDADCECCQAPHLKLFALCPAVAVAEIDVEVQLFPKGFSTTPTSQPVVPPRLYRSAVGRLFWLPVPPGTFGWILSAAGNLFVEGSLQLACSLAEDCLDRVGDAAHVVAWPQPLTNLRRGA